ncbi:acetolactate synthase 2 small subunit [Rodentibacter heidelbergensis]|uniref:Acetolactate synthase 2 small subunit n=1 Tax=Rodentibacter heidelbergensis TaxID=1908258 RepID=A0A1V3I9R0_9PAST|nr:acetolactate synthase 2 small subunit [Rodentibacter heidelbergensis]OOF36700.1 acetolactate synthase 2 small subunit [Rodentibacter heidelbergensis]
MNEYQVELTAHHRPEVLERILRVVRHRGFTVTAVQMVLIESKVQLKITVKSDRTLNLLVNQLVKLPDVMRLKNDY